MTQLYSKFSFIIAFMILVLTFNMMFGNKFIEKFLLLVLCSMLVLNSEKVETIFSGIKGA